jgi:branched-chain amino acid transport system substrate-binding protein
MRSVFQPVISQTSEEKMELEKCQSTILDRCSEEVQQSAKRSISRRKFVQTSAGLVAAGALLGKRAFAAPRPIKIGYVTNETGPLAPFAEADGFILDGVRKHIQGGIQSGGTTRQVEILTRDTQSDLNRAAQVTAELIKSDKVDLVLANGTFLSNPVADQCEVLQMPYLSTNNPWQGFYFARGGTPDKGFDWTYHYFWGVETLSLVMSDVFNQLPTNKVVGLLLGNDSIGNAMGDRKTGAPPVFEAAGYKIFDPGRFTFSITDFSAIISSLKAANAEILFGNIMFPPFSNFWTQAGQQSYKPKIAFICMALLFPNAPDDLGPRARALSTEIWWTNKHPFKSSLTGQSAEQLCDAYEEATKKQWTQTLGFAYSLFESGIDIFKRVQNVDSNQSIIEAVRTIKLNTVIGPVQFQGSPPNPYTKNPVKNVCTTPLVGGQWLPGKKWPYDLIVTANQQYPLIPATHKQEYLPG